MDLTTIYNKETLLVVLQNGLVGREKDPSRMEVDLKSYTTFLKW